jgi:TetR/AcrR family transcriptional regulator, repressor for neighboring sulfatase
MPTPTRRRRTPDQARAEILAAATELIAERGPDAVTLRLVGEAAGVTHGLVTHYFGTYEALVAAVLRRASEERWGRIRERIAADDGVAHAERVMDVLFEAVGDPRYVRLWAWAMLRPQPGAAAGLAEFVDGLEAGIATMLEGPDMPSRARIEGRVLLALSASYGYALGRESWLAGLGHDPADAKHDAEFRDGLIRAVAMNREENGP